jgi:lipopolysaccharide biosynthesis regulator YciM
MLEVLWLLLPVAAISGWLAAQGNLLPKRRHSVFDLSPDYFKGLNYLLNEQPDKAIDAFIKLIDVDSDTVETHLALGALFRRRGEVNRAIRIHQSLVARPTLDSQQRDLALLELSHDYRRAGLLDRAETLFLELTESEEHRVHAYQQLLDIYQQEHEWEKAIQIAKKLASASGEPMWTIIAQYHCEQAEQFTKLHQLSAARQALKQALNTDPTCVRASLLEGKLALEEGETNKAILTFKRVEHQDPDYLPEVIEPLQRCYQQLGQQQEFIAYLREILARYGGITPTLVLADLLKQQKHEQEVADFIIEQLHKRPSIRGLHYLLNLALTQPNSVTHEHLSLLKDMTTRLLKNKPIYKCSHCGFMGKSLHWQCPSCKQWNTAKPIQGLEGE